MFTAIILVVSILLTILLVYLINKFLPAKSKPIVVLIFWVLAIFFGYKLYQSISLPIEFEKVKKERYAAVIERLKDIRDAQEAHRTITGKFAGSFDNLIKFIDTAEFVITQKRDSSFLAYNDIYKIEELREVVVIDTLGFKAVKDSIFKNSDRFREMASIPFAQNNEKFELETDILDNNGYKASVFEVKAKKEVILWDQPKQLLAQENDQIDVEEVNGANIILGSLTDVSTNGNWPPFYDTKKDK